MKHRQLTRLLCCLQLAVCQFTAAQDHARHSDASTKKTDPPKVFLDKSPKIVEYQLKRLSNAELLLIEVATDHPKYIPVFSAVAARPGMSSEQRETAVQALVKMTGRSTAETIFEQLSKLKDSDREQQRVGRELTDLLLRQPAEQVTADTLIPAAASSSQLVSQAAMATLIATGNSQAALKVAAQGEAAQIGLLSAIAIVPIEAQRAAMRSYVIESLHEKLPVGVRIQAARSLPSSGGELNANFEELAQRIREPELEEVAVQSLLKISAAKAGPVLNQEVAQKVAQHLVARAEATPAEQRTSDRFIDAAQLVERLLPRLAERESKTLRQRMQEISVRVVRIKTITGEMRYDLKHFVAAAGKPMQIVMQNDDLMPHNLVIVQPGTLKEVALQAAAMAPDATNGGKQYVPPVPQVLFATRMIQAGKQERLTFTAPTTPGEYPFVCTYPNHWMRMYGVMVVVDDLDAYVANPIEPKDPLGNNRSFVKNWILSDFEDRLATGLRGRTNEIGARIFIEATCLQCHVLSGKGGRVGPDLAEVFKRHQDDSLSVLREIIDPSHKIAPKYATYSVLTLDGQVFSGVIVAEDEKTISLLSQPDQPQPTKLQRSEIDDTVQSPKSIMPAALLDQFTSDEIFELLAYIGASQAN